MVFQKSVKSIYIIYEFKQQPYNVTLCGRTFTVENSQSSKEFITVVNVKHDIF